MTKKSISIASTMLVALSLSLAPAGAKTPDTVTGPGSASATLAMQTLKEVQQLAAAVADAAEQLGTFANPEFNADTHLDKLRVLKSKINQMGQQIHSLEAGRDALAPWEQQAVDNVMPLLQAAAGNAENAIEYFNNNRNHLWTATYRDYTNSVWQDSSQISKTLKDYLKYQKLNDQEAHVQQSIQTDSGQ